MKYVEAEEGSEIFKQHDENATSFFIIGNVHN